MGAACSALPLPACCALVLSMGWVAALSAVALSLVAFSLAALSAAALAGGVSARITLRPSSTGPRTMSPLRLREAPISSDVRVTATPGTARSRSATLRLSIWIFSGKGRQTKGSDGVSGVGSDSATFTTGWVTDRDFIQSLPCSSLPRSQSSTARSTVTSTSSSCQPTPSRVQP